MYLSSRAGEFRWCSHAVERWQERFGGINITSEFHTATLASKNAKKKIRALTPFNAAKYMNGFVGRYYLISRSNIVYVIDSNTSDVVTVFHLYGD